MKIYLAIVHIENPEKGATTPESVANLLLDQKGDEYSLTAELLSPDAPMPNLGYAILELAIYKQSRTIVVLYPAAWRLRLKSLRSQIVWTRKSDKKKYGDIKWKTFPVSSRAEPTRAVRRLKALLKLCK